MSATAQSQAILTNLAAFQYLSNEWYLRTSETAIFERDQTDFVTDTKLKEINTPIVGIR